MEKLEKLLNEIIDTSSLAVSGVFDIKINEEDFSEMLEELNKMDCETLMNKNTVHQAIDNALENNNNQKCILDELIDTNGSKEAKKSVLDEVSYSSKVISSMFRTSEQTKAICDNKIETIEDFEALINSLI
ncbi:MAG: hypothetical protein SO435_08825 [Peptostreptococcus porci]|uniref:hypothetical protein n=1 Tax=Peptostreptococcus porci TaxID=2652282 RepID=UPI002A83B2F1|nr:hypothetical protein [Peptostreptococcus porci]MDY4127968.1 hypothetical protein [Peptostreptococcus porci]MDY4561805.1 hypothetical protein [Peptostreptococcus porci]